MSAPLSDRQPAGPVLPVETAHSVLRPDAASVITGGFWGERRRINAQVGIPQGPRLLESAGNLHNLRLAAGTTTGEYRGDLPFLDSDVTKWLEAAAWQLGDAQAEPVPDLADRMAELTALLAAAQEDSGYLNSWFQVTRPEERFTDLRWGHELYCAGHLMQAAVAHHRATGDGALLDIARRFADHIDSIFGPGKKVDGIGGHAEIETALVELYRETGERRYLDLAGYFVDRHGHGLLTRDNGVDGPAYCQDRVPLREAQSVEGHAVRQLYLLAGATDVAAETGDAELRAAVERLWTAMAATKTHLTGGLGARHERGGLRRPLRTPQRPRLLRDLRRRRLRPVELADGPADRRGPLRRPDRTHPVQRLPRRSLAGRRALAVRQPAPGPRRLHRRGRRPDGPPHPLVPLRLLPAQRHAAAGLPAALPCHHRRGRPSDPPVRHRRYSAGACRRGPRRRRRRHRVSRGAAASRLTVAETPADRPWTLSLRIPHWCPRSTATVDGGGPYGADAPRDGWLRLHRTWRAGRAGRA